MVGVLSNDFSRSVGLSLDKAANESAYSHLGDILPYRLVATNTGYTPLQALVTVTGTLTTAS